MTAADTALTPDSPVAACVTPSPNFGERRGGQRPDILLLHYTGMRSANAALDWLCRAESGVSCHYFVFEDGRIVQLVREADRAWHAGLSSWEGRDDVNSRSIGIEIVNPGHEFGYPDFPESQIGAVIALSRDIVARHNIAPRRVIGHSDVAPARKRDPGEKFPWNRLARAGIGHWIVPAPITDGSILREGDCGAGVGDVKALLRDYGYGIGEGDAYDADTASVVAAFQRHFRPEKVDGVADASTISTLRKLLNGLASIV